MINYSVIQVSFTIVLLYISIISKGQKIDYNVQDGYIAGGYDVVSYFSNTAERGSEKFSTNYEGVKYRFSSQSHLDAFKVNPEKYIPQYGGWCAYAMGSKGDKVKINPETFEIRGGKLYLFYNAFFNNTLTSWRKEGPATLKSKADENWEKIKYKEK